VGVGNRYSVTTKGLTNLTKRGVTVPEALQVVSSPEQVLRPLSETAVAVFGQTAEGRALVVQLEETTAEDNDWDIVDARDLTEAEIGQLQAVRRMRRPEHDQ
jgi:uncharacterized DUF497 family protein